MTPTIKGVRRKKEIMEYLNLNESRYTDLTRACYFINRGSGNAHDWTDRQIAMVERVLKARKELKEAKIALNGGKLWRAGDKK